MAKYVDNKNIFLVGNSIYGPVNTPLKVHSLSQAISMFGDTGSLLDAFRVVKENNSAAEIFLVKTTGEHSSLSLNILNQDGTLIENGMTFKSKHANEEFNNIGITVSETSLSLVYDSTKIGKYSLTYLFDKHLTMCDLAEAVNEDTRNLSSHVFCAVNCDSATMSKDALFVVNQANNLMTGGISGLSYNKNMFYTCLEETYSLLEGNEIDYILPIGANYDDTFTEDEIALSEHYDLNREYLTLKKEEEYVSYYKQLLAFCISQMRFGFVTSGLIGLYKTKDPFLNADDYIKTLSYFKRANEVSEDLLKYKHLVSACAGDVYTSFGTRVHNGYLAYAGLLSKTHITINTTNQRLNDSYTLYNNFQTKDIVQISDLGYTTFRYSPLKQSVVVASGVTTSDDDRFKYICSSRMAQITMREVRKALVPFIGKNLIELMRVKAIEQEMSIVLASLKKFGILTNYSVRNIVVPKSGEVLINLTFQTRYMLEEIEAFTGLGALTDGGDI